MNVRNAALTVTAVLVAGGGLWALGTGAWSETRLMAQEAGEQAARAEVQQQMEPVVKQIAQQAKQAARSADYTRLLVDQLAHRECMEAGTTFYAVPAGEWSAQPESRRRALCDHERRYRAALWDWDDCVALSDEVASCGIRPKPEEVP